MIMLVLLLPYYPFLKEREIEVWHVGSTIHSLCFCLAGKLFLSLGWGGVRVWLSNAKAADIHIRK